MKTANNTTLQIAENTKSFHPYLILENHSGNKNKLGTTISSTKDRHSDSSYTISQLYKALKIHYPTAGPRYWSARCWNLIYWQLVYINIVCVHRLHSLIETDSIIQHARTISVYGYHFIDRPNALDNKNSGIEPLINNAGINLRESLEVIFEQTACSFKLSHKKAFRLVAATSLNALVTLFTKTNQYRAQDIDCYASSWLSVMTPEGEADLLINNNQVELVRKACCMHYLLDPNNCCTDCPRFMST